MSGRGRGGGGGGGGRGAYYKARYGGGRGRGGLNQNSSQHESEPQSAPTGPARDWLQLSTDLQSIDGQQYGLYQRLLGEYVHSGPSFTLSIDHVQGDAYAPPSRVRVVMPWSETGFPNEYLETDVRKTALCDYVSRAAGSIIQAKHLDRNVGNANGGWSAPKGGAFSINMPGQEILPRSSALIAGGDTIELRFTVSLPAAGRTILAQQAYQILAVNLSDLVEQTLLHASLNQEKLSQHIRSAEVQHSLRIQLGERGLLAFVANGSILPRASGASQAPMSGPSLVEFQSPKELEVTLVASDGTRITGMGIPRGITLLTGGGFHGKSTLLQALELGIYNHIPLDGRERIVTDPTAVKIRAEDGRSISQTDISPFISSLPSGKSPSSFSTEDASGSTSMAANIQEALEAGSKTLLIDEDSSATNLLVRDHRMQALIPNEPITPLISRVRALHDDHGVSTVIVIGGLGDWLAVADHIIALDHYTPRYVTAQATAILQRFPGTPASQLPTYGPLPHRTFSLDLEGLRPPFASRKRFIALPALARDAVDDPSRADSGVDLAGLDQLVEIGQARTLAVLLRRVAQLTAARARPLPEILRGLDGAVGVHAALPPSVTGGDLVAVRPAELVAALSRVRGAALTVRRTGT